MIMNIYSIYDKKAKNFNEPQFSPNDEHMKRQFQSLYRGSNGESLFSRYPEDFDLYHVGNFDTETGQINPMDMKIEVKEEPKLIMKGEEFVKNEESD